MQLFALARCPVLCDAGGSRVGGASRNGSLYSCGFTARTPKPFCSDAVGLLDATNTDEFELSTMDARWSGTQSDLTQSDLTTRSLISESTELSSLYGRSTDTSEHAACLHCGSDNSNHPDDGAGVWGWLLRDCSANSEDLGASHSPPLSARSPTSDDDATTTASTPTSPGRRREGEVPPLDMSSTRRSKQLGCCECCSRGHSKGGNRDVERKDEDLCGDLLPGPRLAAA